MQCLSLCIVICTSLFDLARSQHTARLFMIASISAASSWSTLTGISTRQGNSCRHESFVQASQVTKPYPVAVRRAHTGNRSVRQLCLRIPILRAQRQSACSPARQDPDGTLDRHQQSTCRNQSIWRWPPVPCLTFRDSCPSHLAATIMYGENGRPHSISRFDITIKGTKMAARAQRLPGKKADHP